MTKPPLGKVEALLYVLQHVTKRGCARIMTHPHFLIILTINGQQAALKKGSSIEYVSENRIFTDADDYSMEIELPLADCPQNIAIFGMITRKDVDTGDILEYR